MPAPTLLPIAAVAEELTGERPSPPTTWRWVHRGRRGIRLKAMFLQGAWRTTREDFLAFIEAASAAKLARVESSPSSADADASLMAAGLL